MNPVLRKVLEKIRLFWPNVSFRRGFLKDILKNKENFEDANTKGIQWIEPKVKLNAGQALHIDFCLSHCMKVKDLIWYHSPTLNIYNCSSWAVDGKNIWETCIFNIHNNTHIYKYILRFIACIIILIQHALLVITIKAGLLRKPMYCWDFGSEHSYSWEAR